MASKQTPPRPTSAADGAKAAGPNNPGVKPLPVPGKGPNVSKGGKPAPLAAGAAAGSPGAATASGEEEEDQVPEGFFGEFRHWLFASGNYYLASMLIHMVLFLILALILGVRYVAQQIGSAPAFEEVEVAQKEEVPQFKPFEMQEPADVDPSEIDLTMTLPKGEAEEKGKDAQTAEAKFYDNSEKFEEAGGGLKNADPNGPQLGGAGQDFASLRPGPAMKGPGGVGSGVGTGDFAGVGGSGSGIGGRGTGHRDAMLGRYGGTKATERSVAAALNWLARHQNADGSWSIEGFNQHCHGGKCDGLGSVPSNSAGTAMGLLPFLGAGQTHTTKGMYQATVRRGLNWLITHQDKASGNLSAGKERVMYAHGLATIALCEAYGLTKDSKVGYPAQSAIKFIETAQNAETGGWRYNPGEAGDTSVVGWQVMGLKSGQMAELQVSPATLTGAKKYLAATSGGEYGGRFAYTPGGGKTVCMTAVGLLARQYLGASRDDAGLADGTKLLMENMPDKSKRNIYYWYYATQVLHNMLGPEWDTWNRSMRKYLVDTQERTGCPAGSWDPEKPTADAWGNFGGRLMVTSLSCLTLEIYYRYLPLYDLDKKGAAKGADAIGGKAKEN